ncbi:MAG: glycosyltransferase family 4 protein [Gemmatimonadota bacterium]
MRILVINWQDWTHPFAGGAEFHLREVFARLAGRGHQVDLLCTRYRGAASEEQLAGIRVIRRGRAYPLFNYVVPAVYRRELRRHRYDVIVDDINKVPFFVPLFADPPVVALVHHFFGATVFQETNPVFGGYVWLSEQPVARVYRRCRFISVSPSTTDDLVERGIPANRIAMIPNGLPVVPESILAEPKAVAPLFVYLGRLKRYKRIELILEAFARVASRYPAARVVIAGDGDYRSALERHAAALGLGEGVAFPGWIGDGAKWRLLRQAWAVCYTSPREGWGISSLEAQRVGTIAIVSDAPGLRDTVVDGVTGRLVPHGDVGALALALEESIEQPARRAGWEHAAVGRARGFSWETAATATLGVLESAVAERAR